MRAESTDRMEESKQTSLRQELLSLAITISKALPSTGPLGLPGFLPTNTSSRLIMHLGQHTSLVSHRHADIQQKTVTGKPRASSDSDADETPFTTCRNGLGNLTPCHALRSSMSPGMMRLMSRKKFDCIP